MCHSTFIARNGKEAFDLLESEIPSAVLLDLRMPVMSGWSLLEAIKKIPRLSNLPVIIISAYGFEWEAELVGASGYISKPIDVDKIRSAVDQIIGQAEFAFH